MLLERPSFQEQYLRCIYHKKASVPFSTKPRNSAESINEKRSFQPSSTCSSTTPRYSYKDFDEFCKIIKMLKLPADWEVSMHTATDNVKVSMQDTIHTLTMTFEIFVDGDLQFTIRIFMCPILPDDHKIYKVSVKEALEISP